jgi:AraC-like DNA-binding protein
MQTERPGEWLTIGSPLPDVSLMSVRQSDRRWTDYHSDVRVARISPAEKSASAHFRCRSRSHVARAGELMLFEMNDHHVTTNVPVKADFSCVGIPHAVIRDAAEELGVRGEFHLKSVVSDNVRVARAVDDFVQAAAVEPGSLAVEVTFVELVRALVEECGEMPATSRLDPVRHRGVRLLRDLLRDDFSHNHRLDDLAREVGLGKFWLSRTFKTWVGLPPHAYLKLRRAAEARRMIERGQPIADVAAVVGFADAPHLTRTHVHYFGVPPGRWWRAYETNTARRRSVSTRSPSR